MRNFLFVLASTATLTMMNPAVAQYLPPAPGGIGVAPGYTAPGNTTPGYMWREQRANDDWRNNTWREQRANEDWRNNTWQEKRAIEDWQRREDYYTKDRTKDNPAIIPQDRGYGGDCGVGPVGSSTAFCRTNEAAQLGGKTPTINPRTLPGALLPADRIGLPSSARTLPGALLPADRIGLPSSARTLPGALLPADRIGLPSSAPSK
jgi:hypothetical protein